MVGEYTLATYRMFNRTQIECKAISRKKYKNLIRLRELNLYGAAALTILPAHADRTQNGGRSVGLIMYFGCFLWQNLPFKFPSLQQSRLMWNASEMQ